MGGDVGNASESHILKVTDYEISLGCRQEGIKGKVETRPTLILKGRPLLGNAKTALLRGSLDAQLRAPLYNAKAKHIEFFFPFEIWPTYLELVQSESQLYVHFSQRENGSLFATLTTARSL
ncbi:hypothetical protein [Aliiroseovarius marinus]|uniref:hypothetical protein n=1 Tax=Aliiroseovarius marinus TaxID=2500159 RepID=UPI003D7D768D